MKKTIVIGITIACFMQAFAQLRPNAYTTNGQAAADAYVKSIAGSSAGAVTNGGTVVFTSWLCTNELGTLGIGSPQPLTAPQNAKLQSIFDLATNGPVEIHVDGRYAASLLKVRSNTRMVVNPDCGFYVPANSNAPALVNFNYGASSILDSNIWISGLTINGGGSNELHDVTNGLAGYTGFAGWVCGAEFANVRNLNFDKLTIWTPRTFSIFCWNLDGAVFRDTKIDVNPQSGSYNYDGIHVCGPATNIVIDTASLRTCDDAIAFNADDSINFAPYSNAPPNLVYGDIVGVKIQNIFLNNGTLGHDGIRLLTGAHRMDGVSISHIYGTTTFLWLLVGNYWDAGNNATTMNGPGHFGNITVDDADMFINNNSYLGGIQFWAEAWNNTNLCTFDSVVLKNIKHRNYTKTLTLPPSDPLVYIDGGTYKSFTLDGCEFNPTNMASGCAIYLNTGAIDYLRLDNCYFNSRNPTNPFPVVTGYPANSTAYNWQNITNLVGSGNVVVGFTNLIFASNFGISNNACGYSLCPTLNSNLTIYPLVTGGSSATTNAYALIEPVDELFGGTVSNSAYLTATLPAGTYTVAGHICLVTTNSDGTYVKINISQPTTSSFFGNVEWPLTRGNTIRSGNQGQPNGYAVANHDYPMGSGSGDVYVSNSSEDVAPFGYFTLTNSAVVTMKFGSTDANTITIKAGSKVVITTP
jgi:hypothetical protein